MRNANSLVQDLIKYAESANKVYGFKILDHVQKQCLNLMSTNETIQNRFLVYLQLKFKDIWLVQI